MGIRKKAIVLGVILSLLAAGWWGFRVVLREDLIPGRALEIRLVANAWSETTGASTFAIVGDAGTGGRNEFRVALRMAESYQQSPYGLVLTTGDNFYYGDATDRYEEALAEPFGPLLQAGVEFRPVLGNHDLDEDSDLASVLTILGMPARYYRFTRGPVEFFALDSNQMDGGQLDWLRSNLGCSKSRWQVVYMHHPPYSSGTHGSDLALRGKLEPVLVAGGVDIVFAGHDHDYERTSFQQGVVYVVTGSGSKVRSVGSSDFTAVSNAGLHYLRVVVSDDAMIVKAIDDGGEVFDTFTLSPRAALTPCDGGGAAPPQRDP